jgi:fatty acid desaturase
MTTDTMRGSLFAQLSREIKAEGLLDRRPGYYLTKISLTVAAFAGLWVILVLLGPSWWSLAVAGAMAIVSTQLAFIAHDAGHKQIFRGRRANDLLGVALAEGGVGISYGWWIDKHNRHHAHPNHEGHDPDIEPGVFVFVGTDALNRGPLARAWYRMQAYTFLPMLLLEGLNLRFAGLQALAGRREMRYRKLEIVLFGLHVAGYLGTLFAVLTPVQAIVFIAVHQGLFGVYMGCSFAPNHKGMRILTADEDMDFLRRQVLTSRNVTGGRVIDGVLGGLNYQIEHHLFPNMPRPTLRLAQPIIQRFCEEHGVSYEQTGLFDSYRRSIGHLGAAGRAEPAVTSV